MKKKQVLTILLIWLCIIIACSEDFGITSAELTQNLQLTSENFYNDNESEQQFFINQKRSFSILDEVMSPFIREFDEKTETQIYCDSFAGVFIDEDGNLNIGVVQGAITEQVEISMNSLNGQVIYRYDAFSYNYLQQIKNAIVFLLLTHEISLVGIDEMINIVKVYLSCEINAQSVIKHLSDIGLFEESALTFVVNAGVELNNGPVFG